MRTVAISLSALVLLSGCSTAPLADFLDYARPARSPGFMEPLPHPAIPAPAAVPPPVAPSLPATPAPGMTPNVAPSPPPVVPPPPL